jgi:hypothetical protein
MPNLMAKDISHLLDPVRFVEDSLKYSLDDWQKGVLKYEGRQLAMNCSRQSGKSTIAALKALHTALHFPGSLTLIVSPSQRQSGEMFRLVSKEMQKLPDQPKKVEDNKLSMTLQSGSRVVSLPSQEQTVRGFANPKLIIIDEASRCTDSLYLAIRPMLATSENSQLVVLSTPNGRQGFFFDIFESDDDNWKRIKIDAYDCPRISKEFLDDELATLGQYFFNQEYRCAFVEGENAVFRYEDILRCFKNDVQSIDLWGDDFGIKSGT